MSSMTIGGVAITTNEELSGVLTAEKRDAVVETMDGVAYFDFGNFIAGVERTLSWDVMPEALFNSLDALYQASASVVLNPADGSSKTYNIRIRSLTGKLYLPKLVSTGFSFRKDVELDFVIISEVA